MGIPLKVTIFKGSDLVGEQRFDRDIIKIGRLASAHLRLDDSKVSRIHAVIEVSSDGQGFSIIDMGSSDGTFVNGERVSKEKLRDGDEIRVGDCRLLISLDAGGAGTMEVERHEVVSTADLPTGGTAQPTVPPASVAPEAPWAPNSPEWASAASTQMSAAANPLAQQGMMQPDPQMMAAQAAAQASAQAAMAAQAAAMGMPPAMPAMSAAQPQWAAQPMQQDVAVPMGYQQAVAVPSASYAPMAPALPQQQQHQFDDRARPGPAWGQAAQAAAPAVVGAWGSVPNNLASESVPDTDRALEIKTLWGNSVIDTINVVNQPHVTMGDEPKIVGWGPLQKFVRCDIDVPAKNLPDRRFPLAVFQGPPDSDGCNYAINIHSSFTGHVDRADGSGQELADFLKAGRGIERSDIASTSRYNLRAEETLYLQHGTLTMQIRYVRRTKYIPPGIFQDMNYTWVNILILAFFFHVLAIASFLATPKTQEELTEALFKNPNRFAQFRLTPEKKQKEKNDFLSKLKAGAAGAKARGAEGKAGKKDYKGAQGRMAVKAIDPNDKEIAKSSLAKLFGAQGNVGRSYLFGTGGLGGELKGALGAVTGAEIGDATGLGGLGTRGTGPGGGGLSMNSVGLGALGTHGRGGGGSGDGYGSGVGSLGKKMDRDINISAGSPIVMGSLDKELIRRVIEEHKAQIRYCYEKELIRTPGLFGKINIQWTISAEGSVTDAKVKESTMSNAEVERCIVGKLRTWIFPKPKGGGVVIVNYPFVFKQTG